MKKRLLSWSAKLGIVLLFSSLAISTVVLGMALYDTYNEKKDLQDELSAIKESKNTLASNADESQTSLQETIDNLEAQVQSLQKDNKDLESIAFAGYGTIKGEVAQIIYEGSNIGGEQVVCAQSTKNEATLFCVSIQSAKKDYSLVLPAGNYTVFATPANATTIGTSSRAFYTEYVQCLQSNNKDCNPGNDDPVVLEVNEGSVIESVDPIDL